MPAPPPKTANVAARPRPGAAGEAATVLEEALNASLGAMGTAQAPMKAATVRTPIPPRTFCVNVFIILYLLVWIIYVIWPDVKSFLNIY
jgi:hypothetical protein